MILFYEYDPFGFLSSLSSSDRKILYAFEHDKLGHLKGAADEALHVFFKREVDPFGNVLQESFSSGLAVAKRYDDFNRLSSLEIVGNGSVSYYYDPLFLREVTRFSKEGSLLYTHTYEDYDLGGNLALERLIGDLGHVAHETNLRGLKKSISSPCFSQICRYDPLGNLTEIVGQGKYSYDGLSQLVSEKEGRYTYDSLYNRKRKNGEVLEVNDLNELVSSAGKGHSFDLNGNQIVKKVGAEAFHLNYDPLNQLISAISKNKKITFIYDPIGRCLERAVFLKTASGWREIDRESYLYNGQEEIGDFKSPDHPKNFKVLGLAGKVLSIEIGDQVFAPILDVQENVRSLVNLASQEISSSYEFTAFGEPLQVQEEVFNPWKFASKRLDPDLGFIYFGKRYYDPEFARWISTDPAGFIDSTNLYQYVFNNPFRYKDPDGQFVVVVPLLIWGAELVLPSLAAIAIPVIYSVAVGTATYVGYKAVEMLNETAVWKNTEVYAPDRFGFNKEGSIEKRHTPAQEAISDLVKEFGRKGVSNTDADTLLDWGKEYDFPNTRDDRGKPPHWVGGEHIHLGPEHIPIRN